jgi:hypothetical protein
MTKLSRGKNIPFAQRAPKNFFSRRSKNMTLKELNVNY